VLLKKLDKSVNQYLLAREVHSASCACGRHLRQDISDRETLSWPHMACACVRLRTKLQVHARMLHVPSLITCQKKKLMQKRL